MCYAAGIGLRRSSHVGFRPGHGMNNRATQLLLASFIAACAPGDGMAQSQPPLIGIINARSATDSFKDIQALQAGLNQLGFAVGKNVALSSHFANGHYDQLPGFAQDLVQKNVAAIVAGGGATAVRAAKDATDTIPIVFTSGNDPVTFDLVRQFNRPGGNVTGIYIATTTLDAKRLQILSEAMPNAHVIAALLNDTNPTLQKQVTELDSAAHDLKRELLILRAHTTADIEAAFSVMTQRGIKALLIASDPYLNESDLVFSLATKHRIAAASLWRNGPENGGLLSYGTSLDAAYRLAGTYVGRILKGDKPSDLPVQQSSEVELVVSLKAAKAMDLTVPVTLLGRADEIME
jgi:putative ABC transport system substrate-binding protein